MMITIVHVLVLFDITDTNEAVFQYVIFQYVIRSWTWYVYKGYDSTGRFRNHTSGDEIQVSRIRPWTAAAAKKAS